jgi:hypothetical protein
MQLANRTSGSFIATKPWQLISTSSIVSLASYFDLCNCFKPFGAYLDHTFFCSNYLSHFLFILFLESLQCSNLSVYFVFIVHRLSFQSLFIFNYLINLSYFLIFTPAAMFVIIFRLSNPMIFLWLPHKQLFTCSLLLSCFWSVSIEPFSLDLVTLHILSRAAKRPAIKLSLCPLSLSLILSRIVIVFVITQHTQSGNYFSVHFASLTRSRRLASFQCLRGLKLLAL